jgi:branched-chain amino acid transport system ATP-binding protein
MNNGEMLRIDGLSLAFGGIQVLLEVSMQVMKEEILAIIGPNGAGKTSLFNCISGFYKPQKGDIFFEGKNITRFPPHRIAKLGISRTFQNIELYKGLTTLDNLMAARHIHMKRGALSGCLFFGPTQKEEISNRKTVEELIDLLEIKSIRYKVVDTLSYGMRKRVELGRALAAEPKMLILDEPMSGMNVEEKEDMARFILDILELRRMPIVIVEHDMDVVMDISHRIVVLDFGRKIAEGPPIEIKNNQKVIEAYLGVDKNYLL